MKHGIRKLALVLVLALLLSTAALAAEPNAEIKDVFEDCTITFNANNQSVALTATDLTPNGMYLVLVLKGVDTVPTASNILYINQATATEDGTVSFDNIYPKSLVDSTIYLSGTGLTGLTKMGFIDLKVTPGDVDGNSELEVYDALLVLQKGTGLITMTEEQELAADVNGDGSVDQYDALLILQKAVGLIENFPA